MYIDRHGSVYIGVSTTHAVQSVKMAEKETQPNRRIKLQMKKQKWISGLYFVFSLYVHTLSCVKVIKNFLHALLLCLF